MKLREIIHDKGCYVYSTSHRFCFPFTFAPFTTVGPLDGDFSKAISFMWHRKSRRHLEDLHHEVMQAATEHKLIRLYRLSVLAFTFRDTYKGDRGSIAALRLFADGARDSGDDDFPFSPFVLSCLRSFAPTLMPNHDELEKARRVWVEGGRSVTTESTTQKADTKQDRTVRVGDYCRFKPRKTSVTMWHMWEEGLIDLTPGDIVKVVTTPEKNGMCHVNKPGKCPVLVTMELVATDWLEPVNGNFKECEYCGAIDHETSDCPYRGKVPYGRKGDFSWRIEDGKTVLE
jgi:hypothetical protein